MASTFRAQSRAGCFGIIEAYRVANPSLLATATSYPPESFATPHAFIAKGIPERLAHNSGLRQRVLTVSVVVVQKLMANSQVTDETDVLVDALVDAFTAAPHAASGSTLIEPVQVIDGPEIPTSEGIMYSAMTILVECSTQEGRL